jgi:ABC-type transport system involved in multi-copper enzyme maturation permease subunit
VLDLTLGEMLWSRRTVFMALVAGGPVVIALVLRALVDVDWVSVSGSTAGRPLTLTGPGMFGLMVWVFYLRFTVPVLGVFYGTSLIADEVEDKTITYLFTRPVSRGSVLFGKYLAYLICTNLVVLPSVMIVYFLLVPLLGGRIGESFPALLIDLGLLGLGLAVYGALFALVGAWFKRPLLTGLVFVFGWEPIAVVIPGYMKNLTVAFYLQGLVPHAMPQDGMSLVQSMLQAFQAAPSVGSSLVWLGIIWAGALVAATQVVERREYVLEQ